MSFVQERRTEIIMVLLAVVVIGVGVKIKKNRNAQFEAVVDKVSSRGPASVATSDASNSEVDPATGKTKAQIEEDKKRFAKVSREIEKHINDVRQKAHRDIKALEKKVFTQSEVEKHMRSIVSNKDLSNGQRMSQLIMLQNQVSFSGTRINDKQKLLEAIDRQIQAIPMPQPKGMEYQYTDQGVGITPVTK